ncbi:hypothetical protein [Caulobacter sp. AP07]|uniref:hypothetical protein n=1 Tax=Caulobacter sp. AP07 TaxID=1144304 RepID=UPI0012F88163|nr:hypothetical protein [Caulobacter sp. AP07]
MLASAFSVAGVFAGQVQATSCDYRATVMLGDRSVEVHECWDLSKWPEAKAQSFCKTALGGGDGEVQTRPVSACPAPKVAQCTGARFAAPSASSLSPEYLAKMPKEMADRIRANMNGIGAGLRPYDGLETTVNYYAGGVSLADQRQDCVAGKKGQFKPGP